MCACVRVEEKERERERAWQMGVNVSYARWEGGTSICMRALRECAHLRRGKAGRLPYRALSCMRRAQMTRNKIDFEERQMETSVIISKDKHGAARSSSTSLRVQ